MIFTPRPYQDLIVNAGLDCRRLNIFASVGMGKTTASYLLFDKLRLFGEARRAVVFAPKRVALSSWPGEVHKWHESFGHLRVATAIGTPQQRLAAVQSDPDILTINYENIPWLIEVLGDQWPYDTVFADESTALSSHRVSLQTSKLGAEYLRGQGGKRAALLAKTAITRVHNWYNLTGSFATRGLHNAWGQQFFIDQGKRLGRSFSAFEQRWFRHSIPGNLQSPLEPMPWAEEQIREALRDCSITVDARDWFPLEDVIERQVMVELPKKAREAYDEMSRELYTDLLANDVEALNGAGKANKCRQIASGTVFYGEHGEWQAVHDEKLDALKSIVQEANGENILVSYQFVPERERILKAFSKARFLDKNPQTISDWNAGKIPILVLHPASAGHGLNLQDGGRILVDFTTGWDAEQDEQVIGRIGPTRQAQSGYKRSVFRYRIVARNTIEEQVIQRLRTRVSVQEALMQAMKRLAL